MTQVDGDDPPGANHRSEFAERVDPLERATEDHEVRRRPRGCPILSSILRRERYAWCRRSTPCPRGRSHRSCGSRATTCAVPSGPCRPSTGRTSGTVRSLRGSTARAASAAWRDPDEAGEVPTPMIAAPLQRSIPRRVRELVDPRPDGVLGLAKPLDVCVQRKVPRVRRCQGQSYSLDIGRWPRLDPPLRVAVHGLRSSDTIVTDGVRSHRARVLSALCSQRRARTKLSRFVFRAGG